MRILYSILLFPLCIFFSFQTFCQATSPKEYLSEIKQDLQKKWPRNRTITLLFHGHSVPAGYFKTPTVNTFGAYPLQLLGLIKEEYPYAIVNVINTAKGGENAESGENRFIADVLSHKPDVLFLDYALNDRSIGLKKAKKAWESMIKQALALEIKVILLTPSPDQRVDMLEKGNELEKHTEQIRELVDKHKIAIVDSYALFKEKILSGEDIKCYMSQVNHPNEKGHALIAEALFGFFEL